jgi:imidazolonepropionase-like amidohydrolase
MRKTLVLLVVSVMGSVAQAQRVAPPDTLIRNATVITVTRGTLENTDVLLRNGKIAAVGKNLNAPSNARIIDGTGKYVMPGIIDCHSHSMLDTINEGTLSVTSMVRTEDVLNPTDIDLYRELAGGVTTLNLLRVSFCFRARCPGSSLRLVKT